MRRNSSWDDILVLPDDLRAFAWSAPMRDLAAKLNLSDVGPVPEDLEDLRAQELKAIGRAVAPKTFDGAHRGLADLLTKEQRRRQKVAERDWYWDQPKFDTPLAKRQLRILNGLFMALSRRGHDGSAYEDHTGELHARAIIGDTYMGLEFMIPGKHRTVRAHGEAPARRPST